MPNNFEALVFEREAFFGTDFLPMVAFPHPQCIDWIGNSDCCCPFEETNILV